MSRAPVLVCEWLIFYNQKDEEAFNDWLRKINCIERTSRSGSTLELHIVSLDLHDHDIDDLISLFYRYSIDMKQLSVFLNDDNRKWFYDKKMYWFNKVFGK